MAEKKKMKLDPKEQKDEQESKHEQKPAKKDKDEEGEMNPGMDHPMAEKLRSDIESSDKHMDGHAHELLKSYDSYKRPRQD